MKKTLISLLLVFGVSTLHAGQSAVGSLTFGNDTRQVAVSTNCATPTQILTNDSFVSHTFVINNSTWTNLLISSASTAISNTANFFVPASSTFSPDGPQDAFDGAMWACSTATVSGVQAANVAKVGVFRAK